MLNGKKTYVVALFAILYAVGGYYSMEMNLNEAMQYVVTALGLGALRHGVARNGGS